MLWGGGEGEGAARKPAVDYRSAQIKGLCEVSPDRLFSVTGKGQLLLLEVKASCLLLPTFGKEGVSSERVALLKTFN